MVPAAAPPTRAGRVPSAPARPESAVERIRDGYRSTGMLDDGLLDGDLAKAAAHRPGAVFTSDSRGACSYRHVWRDVLGLAGALRDLGVGRGDIVSFQLPNRVEAAVAYYATIALGAICNPIVPTYREHEVGFVLGQARPKVMVVPASYRGVDLVAMHRRAGAAAGHHPILVIVGPDASGGDGGRSYADCTAHRPAAPLEARTGSDPAVLLYTSGTTADPKGVLHSHQSLRYECRSMIDNAGLLGTDIVFMASPVTHVTGLLYGLQLPAMIGASSVLQETWDAAGAVALIRSAGCTFTVGATPFLHGLVDVVRKEGPGGGGSLEMLRTFVCGGADVPPDLVALARAELGVEVVRAYGLSELPTVTCGGLNDRADKRAGTDGRPLPGTRVRVRYENGSASAQGSGELEASAPELFLGYLDPTLDSAAFTDDGWFRTGDLASVDADGYVTILGRIKDVIVRGGENISAKEVEDALFEHPGVSEIALVGYPDPVMGQRMCAFVVPAGPAAPTVAELAAFLDDRGFARLKAPERIEVVDALPKTASGKIQKHRLRALAAGPAVDTVGSAVR